MNPLTALFALFTGSVVLDFIKKMQTKYHYQSVGEMSKAEVRDIIKAHSLASVEPVMTDSMYYTFKKSDAVDFVNKDDTDAIPYVKDKWDCDNFAFLRYSKAELAMPGCIFGVCFCFTPTGNHALNFYVDENKNFWIQESQAKTFIPKPDDYTIHFALV